MRPSFASALHWRQREVGRLLRLTFTAERGPICTASPPHSCSCWHQGVVAAVSPRGDGLRLFATGFIGVFSSLRCSADDRRFVWGIERAAEAWQGGVCHDDAGRTIKGKLTDLSATSLKVRVDGQEETLPESQVREITERRPE